MNKINELELQIRIMANIIDTQEKIIEELKKAKVFSSNAVLMETKESILSKHFNEIEEENQLSIIQKELVKNAMDEWKEVVKNNSVKPDIIKSFLPSVKEVRNAAINYAYDCWHDDINFEQEKKYAKKDFIAGIEWLCEKLECKNV